jgi:hypothetical protein
MINRGVLIVRPAQPFLDWAAGLDDFGMVPDAAGEQTVYLIPNWETDEDAEEILEQLHLGVFENELWGWHTEESAWPERRDLATFRKWFRIEMHSIVEDLCDYELVEEDED